MEKGKQKNSCYFQMNWNTGSRMYAGAANRKCVCTGTVRRNGGERINSTRCHNSPIQVYILYSWTDPEGQWLESCLQRWFKDDICEIEWGGDSLPPLKLKMPEDAGAPWVIPKKPHWQEFAWLYPRGDSVKTSKPGLHLISSHVQQLFTNSSSRKPLFVQ